RRQPGARVRFDLVDADVLGDFLLDAAGDQLFDFLGAGARPRHERERLLDRDVRILALRHVQEPEDAPGDGADQQRPRDVAPLGEEPRGVVRVRDDVLIAAAVAHGITRTSSPSLSRLAPITTSRSPAWTPPLTATRLPVTRPSAIVRAWTIALSARPSATNTA